VVLATREHHAEWQALTLLRASDLKQSIKSYPNARWRREASRQAAGKNQNNKTKLAEGDNAADRQERCSGEERGCAEKRGMIL
jgi:hypothetical protein